MLLDVFSVNLDPQKHWFALNTELCGIVAKKFCQNEIFKLFEDEVKCINIHECLDQNGGPIPKPQGKTDNKINVGSTFAVIAGNLRRKDPSASGLLKNSNFKNIIDILNHQSLIATSNDNNDEANNIKILTPDSLSLDSSISPNSSSSGFVSSFSSSSGNDGEKGSLKRKRLAPKKLAPFLTSTPVANRTCNLTEYETPYKKRKTRDKAVSLITEVQEICNDNQETLSSVIARCCLIERRDNVECHQIIQDVFLEVEEKLGLNETFEKLIPDNLWQKKLQQMTVPDWQLLHLKLEIPISDDKWQTLLNRTHLGKGGVSIVLN